MSMEIKKQQHITEEMWIALEKNTIQQEKFMQILEHTCDCTWCADRMAEVMQTRDHELIAKDFVSVKPPAYLAEQILERTAQVDIQTVVKVKRTSKRMQLFMYSLKVGAAVLVSILILGITGNFQDVGFYPLEQSEWEVQQESEDGNWEERKQQETFLDRMNQATNGMTEKMNAFTNRILNGGKE